MHSFETWLLVASIAAGVGCGESEAPSETAGSGGAQGGASGAGAATTVGSGGSAGGKSGSAGAAGAGGIANDAARDDVADATLFDIGSGGSGSDASSTARDATGNLDDASAHCNDMVNVAPVIGGRLVAENIPSPRGGTMVDGTYFETAFTVYTGAGGAVGPEGVDHQLTAVIEGGMAHVAVLDRVQKRYEFAITTSANMTTWSFLCPQGGVVPYGYDASPTEIVPYITSDPAKVRTFTLTRQ